MANTINLNITPLVPLDTDSYTLPSSHSRPPLAPPPNKRLRSCLSPARSRPSTPFDERSEPSLSGYTSRSTSYGSERSKSVRWEEGDVPVTSYFHTWSGDEYDRTPLEAPSAEERACVLPERNSRCMTRTYHCFLSDGIDDVYPAHPQSPSPIHDSPLSSPALAALDEALTAIHELPCEGLDSDDDEDDADLHGRRETGFEEEDDEDEAEGEEEESGWDECMRRRMMFLQYSRQDGDRQPQFDGYRSISSTIADVLRSVGCDHQTDSPAAADVSVEASISAETLKLVDTRPPNTPSLTSASTSASEDSSEADTLVNTDIAPPASPDIEHLEIKFAIEDASLPASVSITTPQTPT